MPSNWTFYGLGDFDDAYLDATPAGKNIKIGKMEGDQVVYLTGGFHLVFSWPSCHFVITEIAAE